MQDLSQPSSPSISALAEVAGLQPDASIEASAAPITDVQAFVNRVSSLPPGFDGLDGVLKPSLEAEVNLRKVFATQPRDPRLSDPFVGLLNVFSSPAALRLSRPRNAAATPEEHSSHHIFPLSHAQRRMGSEPSTVATLEDFKARFDVFTSGALRLMDWTNVIAAGGSVLASLAPETRRERDMPLGTFFHQVEYPTSDVDLFLYGLTPEQAPLKMLEIHEAVLRAVRFEAVCIRKKQVITIYFQFPFRPIQIILRLYQSPSEVLTGFDVDCSCIGFDGTSVFANPRAVVALMRQANTLDISRRSPSYEVRLSKYAKRGFEVYVPTLERQQIRPEIYDPSLPLFPRGLARLLVLEAMATNSVQYSSIKEPEKRNLSSAFHHSDVAVQEALEVSFYSSSYIHIPYAEGWNVERIRSLVETTNLRLDYVANIDRPDGAPYYHRHSMFCGTMVECLGNFCLDCPTPVSRHERDAYIYGPVSFITENPGRQLLSGSFRPIDDEEWEVDAYKTMAPRVDIYDELLEVIAVVELPGVASSDLSIRYRNNALVISGNRRPMLSSTSQGQLACEITHGRFRRVLPVPNQSCVGPARARLRQGLLTIRWPKLARNENPDF